MEAVVLRLDGESFEVLARLRRPTDRDVWLSLPSSKRCGLILDTAAQASLGGASSDRDRNARQHQPPQRSYQNSNLTCLNGDRFAPMSSAKLGQPVRFANDANCFALSEARFGAGRGHRVVFGVILGTGVGVAALVFSWR